MINVNFCNDLVSLPTILISSKKMANKPEICGLYINTNDKCINCAYLVILIYKIFFYSTSIVKIPSGEDSLRIKVFYTKIKGKERKYNFLSHRIR